MWSGREIAKICKTTLHIYNRSFFIKFYYYYLKIITTKTKKKYYYDDFYFFSIVNEIYNIDHASSAHVHNAHAAQLHQLENRQMVCILNINLSHFSP